MALLILKFNSIILLTYPSLQIHYCSTAFNFNSSITAQNANTLDTNVMAVSVKLIENSARNHKKLTLEQLSVMWEASEPVWSSSLWGASVCRSTWAFEPHQGGHPAVSACSPLSWSAEHTAANRASTPNSQCTTQRGRSHVSKVWHHLRG